MLSFERSTNVVCCLALFCLIGGLAASDASADIDAKTRLEWSDGISDEQLSRLMTDYYAKAADLYEATELQRGAQQSIARRLVFGFYASGDDRALQAYLGSLEPEQRASLQDQVIKKAQRGEPSLRSAVVVDEAAKEEDELLRVASLMGFFATSDRQPADDASARAIELLEQALQTIELPDEPQAADPGRRGVLNYPGRERVINALAGAYIRHGAYDKAEQWLLLIKPSGNWYSNVLRLTLALDASGQADDIGDFLGRVAVVFDGSEPTDRTKSAWLQFAALQYKHGEPIEAVKTLDPMIDWAIGIEDKSSSAMKLREIAGYCLKGGDRASVKRVLDAAAEQAALITDAKQRDHVFYALSGVCVTHNEPSLAAELLKRVEDPRHAMFQARNIVILHLYAGDAEATTFALEHAVALAPGNREKQELNREFSPWIERLKAGEAFQSNTPMQDIHSAIAAMAMQGQLDQIDPYLDKLSYQGKDRVAVMCAVVRARESSENAPWLGPLLKVVARTASESEYADPSVRRPKMPVIRQVGSAFGGGPVVIDVPTTIPVGYPMITTPSSSALISSIFKQTKIDNLTGQKVQWLAQPLACQMWLGFGGDAAAQIRAEKDDVAATLAGVYAYRIAEEMKADPADLAPVHAAISERAKQCEANVRTFALLVIGVPGPGDSEVGQTLYTRIASLKRMRQGGHLAFIGGMGHKSWASDPFDERYRRAYEKAVLGDEVGFDNAMKNLHNSADVVQEPHRRARAYRTLAGIEAVFDRPDAARDSLVKATEQLVIFANGLAAAEVEPGFLTDRHAQSLVEDVVAWRETLGVKGGEAELGSALTKIALAVPEREGGHGRIDLNNTVVGALLTLEQDAEAEQVLTHAVQDVLKRGQTEKSFLERFSVTVLKKGGSAEAIWSAAAAYPDVAARNEGLQWASLPLLLSDPDGWARRVDADITDIDRRAQFYLNAADHLGRIRGWRKTRQER